MELMAIKDHFQQYYTTQIKEIAYLYIKTCSYFQSLLMTSISYLAILDLNSVSIGVDSSIS